MKINIEQIKEITLLLLSKLQESKGNEIELNSDYYWAFADEEIYNPYEDPKSITLGQLSDELDEIYRLLKSDDTIAYDLKRLSNIFRALYVENPTAF